MIRSCLPFLLLVSCSLFPTPVGSISKYILTAPSGTGGIVLKQKTDKTLVILQPTLSGALQDHNSIVYQPTPQKIEYLAGGEWAQKLDLMTWETLLMGASHKFKSVVSDPASVSGDAYYILKTHVLTLGVEQINNQPQAHAVYEFTLLDKDNIVISQAKINNTIPVKNMSLDDIVTQLNTVHQKTINQFLMTI